MIMLKYLDYVTNEISKIEPTLVEELNIYKNMYIKYEKSSLLSPIYKGTAELFNMHNFLNMPNLQQHNIFP